MAFKKNPQKPTNLFLAGSCFKTRLVFTRTDKLRHQTTDRIQKLSRDLSLSKSELLKLRTEMEEKEIAKEKMRDDYERRVRGFEMQVSKLKTRQKEWERVARDKDVAERKVVELKEEVGRLGVMIGGLKKRVKEGKELKKKK